MIVARQFIAWNTPKKGEPSRRDGVSRAARHIHRPWSKNVLSAESYRSLRDEDSQHLSTNSTPDQSDGVFEYRAKSELHPRSGLGMLEVVLPKALCLIVGRTGLRDN
jgi:hypothetical protein